MNKKINGEHLSFLVTGAIGSNLCTGSLKNKVGIQIPDVSGIGIANVRSDPKKFVLQGHLKAGRFVQFSNGLPFQKWTKMSGFQMVDNSHSKTGRKCLIFEYWMAKTSGFQMFLIQMFGIRIVTVPLN